MNPATDTKNTQTRSGLFPATHWSVLAQAASGTRNPALEELCHKYWRPVYVFVRRRGVDRHQAQDLTQGFFLFLIEKQTLKKVDPSKGKFRTFLLAALTNFLANEKDKQQALKRGGHIQIASLDEKTDEGLSLHEPATLDPEKSFDRFWALSVLENTMNRFKSQQLQGGKAALFAELEPALTGVPDSGWYAKVASTLGMTENSVRVALHRLRRQYGESLRMEIRQTVESDDAVDGEIRHLFAAISD